MELNNEESNLLASFLFVSKDTNDIPKENWLVNLSPKILGQSFKIYQ